MFPTSYAFYLPPFACPTPTPLLSLAPQFFSLLFFLFLLKNFCMQYILIIPLHLSFMRLCFIYSLDWPWSYGLLPSTFQVLRLPVCTTMPGLLFLSCINFKEPYSLELGVRLPDIILPLYHLPLCIAVRLLSSYSCLGLSSVKQCVGRTSFIVLFWGLC